MKIKNKAGLIIGLFGLGSLILLCIIFFIQNTQILKDKEVEKLEEISQEVSDHLQSQLLEQAKVAITLSSAPVIRDALIISNADYSLLSDEERDEEINNLNEQWKNTSDINDPFIQVYLTNSVAEFLRKQQGNFSGTYGEIFLTNRYGVLIASTGKLTTLAHSQKYWWQASYANGNGKIFFDDRGFDASVAGYVLGIVVPIKYENQVIGILKSNVNILGPLSNMVQLHSNEFFRTVQLVRTNGLIVVEAGVEPLTTKLGENYIEHLKSKESGSTIVSENNIDYAFAYAPVEVTLGSDEFGFGGKYESIDQIKGNTGEAWHLVITSDLRNIVITEYESFKFILIFGGIFFIFTTLIAYLFGNWVSKPIENLIMLDELTGLFSRRGFFVLAEQQMEYSQRTGMEMVLVYADLNGLKNINDTFGHESGDQAIIGAAMILKETFRDSDIVARIGGDEYAILSLNTSENNIETIKERLQKVQANFSQKSKHDFEITLSIGFATYHPDIHVSIDELLKIADEMMYIDKQCRFSQGLGGRLKNLL